MISPSNQTKPNILLSNRIKLTLPRQKGKILRPLKSILFSRMAGPTTITLTVTSDSQTHQIIAYQLMCLYFDFMDSAPLGDVPCLPLFIPLLSLNQDWGLVT